jgi:hypothetical protein
MLGGSVGLAVLAILAAQSTDIQTGHAARTAALASGYDRAFLIAALIALAPAAVTALAPAAPPSAPLDAETGRRSPAHSEQPGEPGDAAGGGHDRRAALAASSARQDGQRPH